MNNNDRQPFFTREQILDVINSRNSIGAKVGRLLPKMLDSTASQDELQWLAQLIETNESILDSLLARELHFSTRHPSEPADIEENLRRLTTST